MNETISKLKKALEGRYLLQALDACAYSLKDEIRTIVADAAQFLFITGELRPHHLMSESVSAHDIADMGAASAHLAGFKRKPTADQAEWLFTHTDVTADWLAGATRGEVWCECRRAIQSYNAGRAVVADAAWWLIENFNKQDDNHSEFLIWAPADTILHVRHGIAQWCASNIERVEAIHVDSVDQLRAVVYTLGKGIKISGHGPATVTHIVTR